MRHPQDLWTPPDDDIVRTHYPQGGTKACQSLLPNRTKRAIRIRAQYLGVTFVGSRQVIFLDEESAIALYREHRDMEKVAALMGTTDYAIDRTLRKHGIKLEPLHRTDQYREAITADYLSGTMVNDEICAKHRISRSELHRAVKRWGINDPHRQRTLLTHGGISPNRKPMYDCWVTSHGKTEADKRWALWVEKQRVSSTGSNNPMYGKPSPQGAGNGWKGWYGPHYFRSLREACFMLDLDKQDILWQGGESIRIPYTLNGVSRTYRPDYLVNKTVVIEVKPLKLHNTPAVNAKRIAAEAFCAERGLTYKVVDVVIDHDALYAAYQSGLLRFDRDYESRFLAFTSPPKPQKEDNAN